MNSTFANLTTCSVHDDCLVLHESWKGCPICADETVWEERVDALQDEVQALERETLELRDQLDETRRE